MKQPIEEKLIRIKNEEEMASFAEGLAALLEPGDVIALMGDLGAGKTTLTKYIARGLGITEMVSSPTFNIIKEYRSGRLPLFHFDVYRLSDADELLDIGGDEYFYENGVCIVEWADIVESIIPEDAILINIEYGENEGERVLTIC